MGRRGQAARGNADGAELRSGRAREMRLVTALYLVALLLITLFSDVIFGMSAQSLAYGPLALALLALVYLALTDGPQDFLHRWYASSPMMAAGLLFLAGLAASMPNAHEVGLAAKDFLRWSFVWLVYAPVTRALCDDAGRCRLFAQATGAFVIGFAALAVGDLLAGGGLTRAIIGQAGVSAEGRHASLYDNPGIFAGMLIVGFPLALVPALSERGLRRPAWLAGAGVIVTGMLISGSRAALAAAVVAMLAIALTQRRWWLVGATAAVVIGLGALVNARALEGPPALERLQQLATHTGAGERSLRRRALIWSVAGELVQRSPFIGVGGCQLRFHQHAGFKRAHNAWLDAWVDGGLLAALAMLLVTTQVLRRAWATLTHRRRLYLEPTHVALVAACLAVLTGWLVRAGIGGRIDWLPIFMLFGLWWERGRGSGEGAKRCSARKQGTPAVEVCD